MRAKLDIHAGGAFLVRRGTEMEGVHRLQLDSVGEVRNEVGGEQVVGGVEQGVVKVKHKRKAAGLEQMARVDGGPRLGLGPRHGQLLGCVRDLDPLNGVCGVGKVQRLGGLAADGADALEDYRVGTELDQGQGGSGWLYERLLLKIDFD
ncbi:FCP1like phosphatase phosphatase subfamily protein [Gracilaria domingensis]|nr:FCP1like phosphatase phosphatase subfamily protein [Gracilaria domingensis]